MRKTKTKGFSYDPEEDMDVIDHLDKQPNFSLYLKELVRKDMKNNSIEEIVKRQIEKYLQGMNLSAGINNKNTMEISELDIKNILDL